uniref:NADPH--cytochrome P450 reductase n=1 Tax=Megafenestra aurita TaxID=2291010 RepID=A0A4Y7NGD2_9CRUS|nr:EOG090X027R [Megafenestra aurita]SVE92258.1 EOG090X027R [Megafenestra aurita]
MDEEVQAAVAPMFGVLDIVLLAGMAGFGVYWVYFRGGSKPQPPPTKGYTMQPTLITPKASESSYITKMKASGRNIVVFYGSQTGTAEEFAGRLAKEAARYGMKALVADPEECEMEELSKLSEINNSMAVFCMATYGEGDPTDNAQAFYEWLQSGDAELSGVNFAVFGLGNKTYEHFNAMGKYVDKRLEELGATRVVEAGVGDDDGNMEEDFLTWKDKFWPSVLDFFGLEMNLQEISMRQYRLVIPDVIPEKLFTGEIARLRAYQTQRPPFDAKNPFLAPVIAWRELHKGGERSCMHIELDLSNSKLRYDAGDHVAVYPVNDPALVNRFGELLSVDLDTPISLVNIDEDSSKKHPFPCPCTYRTALSYYLDITSNPRTHVLKELAEHTSDPEEKEKLLKMTSSNPEGKEIYQQWVLHDNRSLLHILEDLPSCKPPLDLVCELLTRLQSRYYSISSSSKVYPESVHITAVLLKYATPTGRVNNGVATTWLSAKKPVSDQPPPQVPIFIRKSQFRLPARPQTPIIMIGPGTGVAPFRGFVQERLKMKQEGKPVGDTVLFFGCRNRAEDFLYEEEFKESIDAGLLTLHTAFSRETEKKVYVTHLLKDHGEYVWRILGQENGHIYVCGDARNMARDVHDIIIETCSKYGQMSASEAQAFVKKLETQRRYSADVWS